MKQKMEFFIIKKELRKERNLPYFLSCKQFTRLSFKYASVIYDNKEVEHNWFVLKLVDGTSKVFIKSFALFYITP